MEHLKKALLGLLHGDWRDNHLTPQVKEKYLQIVDSFCQPGMEIEDIFLSLVGFWPGEKLKNSLSVYRGFLNYRNYSAQEKEKLAAISLIQGGTVGKESLEILLKEV